MSSGSILPYTESERTTILKVYGRTPENIKDDIENIKDWMAKQAHLPEVADDNLIERFLLLNKFRIEITKKKLDMYYTVRTILPELYDKDPSCPEMQKAMDVVYFITLPKFTKELYRVTIGMLKDHNPEHFDPILLVIQILSTVDIRLREDYSMSDVLIFDLGSVTLSHLIKFNPLFVGRCGLIVQKVFSNRIAGIHFINTPAFAESFIYLLTKLLSPKLMQRVHIHKNSESLQKLVPPEVLPLEYGGTERSLVELNEDWKRRLVEYKETFQQLRCLLVDEKLRVEESPVDEFFGANGNFRKLELD